MVTDTEVKESLRSACSEDWFISSPVIIVACAHPEKAWVRRNGLFRREEYWKVDVAIALQNLILAAWGDGLGTCWIGSFKEEEVKRVLGIPDNVRVVAMTPLGYPAEEKKPATDRKHLEEIVHYDHW